LGVIEKGFVQPGEVQKNLFCGMTNVWVIAFRVLREHHVKTADNIGAGEMAEPGPEKEIRFFLIERLIVVIYLHHSAAVGSKS
jgi:hypothetical protein